MYIQPLGNSQVCHPRNVFIGDLNAQSFEILLQILAHETKPA